MNLLVLVHERVERVKELLPCVLSCRPMNWTSSTISTSNRAEDFLKSSSLRCAQCLNKTVHKLFRREIRNVSSGLRILKLLRDRRASGAFYPETDANITGTAGLNVTGRPFRQARRAAACGQLVGFADTKRCPKLKRRIKRGSV